MSEQFRCDSCDKRLFPQETPVTILDVILTDVYRPHEPHEYHFDLCPDCRVKVALALKPYLVHLAHRMEPDISRQDRKAQEEAGA